MMVRLTCVLNKLADDDDDDVGYLCANFSLPWALCSRHRLDVRDRQTSVVRRASSLNALYL